MLKPKRLLTWGAKRGFVPLAKPRTLAPKPRMASVTGLFICLSSSNI